MLILLLLFIVFVSHHPLVLPFSMVVQKQNLTEIASCFLNNYSNEMNYTNYANYLGNGPHLIREILMSAQPSIFLRNLELIRR